MHVIVRRLATRSELARGRPWRRPASPRSSLPPSVHHVKRGRSSTRAGVLWPRWRRRGSGGPGRRRPAPGCGALLRGGLAYRDTVRSHRVSAGSAPARARRDGFNPTTPTRIHNRARAILRVSGSPSVVRAGRVGRCPAPALGFPLSEHDGWALRRCLPHGAHRPRSRASRKSYAISPISVALTAWHAADQAFSSPFWPDRTGWRRNLNPAASPPFALG